LKTFELPFEIKSNGPVVIGGVGGSGTRVVVEILTALGYYLGNDLNGPGDYLGYTLLFKRRNWFIRNFEKKCFEPAFRIIQESFLHESPLSVRELWFLTNATFSMALHGHNHLREGRGWWAVNRAQRLLSQNTVFSSAYRGWGWKEPNTHLVITEMNNYFKNFKYIHVIRHGLDMAFSENQQQLFNWGPLFGVGIPAFKDHIPLASFQYWVKANKAALETGKSLGTRKFHLLNFDKLCTDTKHEVEKLGIFLGVDFERTFYQKVCELPKTPASSGRYKQNDISNFPDDDLAFLEELGFGY